MESSTQPVSRYSNKNTIRLSVFHLSKRLVSVDTELKKNDYYITSVLGVYVYVIRIHVKVINDIIELNKQTNMGLGYNFIVRLCTGEKLTFSNFCKMFNQRIEPLNRMGKEDLTIRM